MTVVLIQGQRRENHTKKIGRKEQSEERAR